MRTAVVLVGHGGVPTDAPRALVTELRRLEATRRADGGDPSPREREVGRTHVGHVASTPETDLDATAALFEAPLRRYLVA